MPYRHAHWWILALFPLIAVAFWPNYLGQFRAAPLGLHAHGMTAAAWLALLAVQSWAIHARRVDWHRAAGLATFVVLPLFAAAGPLALQGMIALFVAKADPFHSAYGARLAIADTVAGPSVIALVIYAFANRRRLRAHAAAMLATALLVLPPIFGRLLPMLPGFPGERAFGLPAFELSFQLSEMIPVLVALGLAKRDPISRPAFDFVTLVSLVQMVGFATIGRSGAWERLAAGLLAIPAALLSLTAGGVALALLVWAWRRVPPRRSVATGSFAPAAT